ncbi:ROK family protein [Kiritimatiella glycovorans]|uniref:Transcriptional regulator/sugar kinase n=1 Tax=Kiritimatiella glycovorans TaxID=1307763 RepID=A0A0G3EMS5_9BACT|nr:ROK family protein [Kiritimatiella glycovorans]AKJ65409.1 Transcriptional regulator/sugar kinase [Kiritimatiella glycovorans]
MAIAGIDIGGTKTAAAVGDEQGTLLDAVRVPTDPGDGEDTLRRLTELIDPLIRRHAPDGLKAVGVSAPGPLDCHGQRMLTSPNMDWSGLHLGSLLRERFDAPVYMNNDANAAALAEWMFGACAGADPFIYLTMSTGIGGGIISSGRILQGVNDNAGEIGHITLELDGLPCSCGLKGCFEAYCGGRATADRLRAEIVDRHIDTLILEEAGGDPARISMREFSAAVRRRDPYALERWDEYMERMAQGVGSILMAFNPAAAVLGTIAMHEEDLVMDDLRARLKAYTWKPVYDGCRLEVTRLDRLGERGALAVALAGLSGTQHV